MRRRLNRSHQGARTNREQQVKRVAVAKSLERGHAALFGVSTSICLVVASCVVVPFTIRRWNEGPTTSGSPRHHVDLLDAKDGINELNTTRTAGNKSRRAKARKHKQVGVKKSSQCKVCRN
jgi:hypothetical protein